MNIDEMLPKVKECELEILQVVHTFCVEHKIKYSLAYGTMLGAIRHKGFIPWDDDIDIFMLREDYERFEKLWLENQVDGYILESAKTNPNYTQCLTKIRKDHTAFIQNEEERNSKYHTGVFVDIFLLDRVADTEELQKKQRINAMLYYLYTRGFAFDRGSKLVQYGCKVLLGIVPKSKYSNVATKFEKKLAKYNDHKDNNLICYCTMGSLDHIFPKETFDGIIDIEFEDKNFMCSKYYDAVLKVVYGDYMQLPPEEERTWKHHPIIIDLEHNYDEIKEN